MAETPGDTAPRGVSRRKGSRDRRFAISAAAIRLFSERGLEATTVDDIAAAAGVAPRTFFRHFATKEEAVFPDHDERIVDLRLKLAERNGSVDPLVTVIEVAKASAMQYLNDPALYRPRFQLVRSNQPLRDRERLIDHSYETVIAEYLQTQLSPAPAAAMRARAVAAGVVAAVNYALDLWVDASDSEAREALNRGLDLLADAFAPMMGRGVAIGGDVITVTIPASADLQDSLAQVLDRALAKPVAAPDRKSSP